MKTMGILKSFAVGALMIGLGAVECEARTIVVTRAPRLRPVAPRVAVVAPARVAVVKVAPPALVARPRLAARAEVRHEVREAIDDRIDN